MIIYDTYEAALKVLRVHQVRGHVTKFRRILCDDWHRLLDADGVVYCGDFMRCGCSFRKLVRVAPVEGGFVVQQASALLGVEFVWSNYRWNQCQPWDGEVDIVEYDKGNQSVWC